MAQPPKPPTPAAERGRTLLTVGLVEKIAATAALEVAGVHKVGHGVSRALGARCGRSGAGPGVKAEVGQTQAAIDIALVVDYDVVIPTLAAEARAKIIAAVEKMTGLEVIEANIAVNDVHLPNDPDSEPDELPVSGRRRLR